MTRRSGPRADSVAYRLLVALCAAPKGILTNRQLLPLLQQDNRTIWKLSQQADVLDARNLALRLHDGLQILPMGRAYLIEQAGMAVPSALLKPVARTSMALPRTVPAFKPLDMARLMRNRPQREGMDDMRTAPSLMGNTRVLHAFRLLTKGGK